MKEEWIQPTLLFSVMCDDVRREDNGKFILIGLFETIGAKTLPAVHPALYIMNCWIGGSGEFRQKTRVMDAGGNVLTEDKETSFMLKNLKAKHRVIARFNGLRFKQDGEYSIEVLLNGELHIRYPLIVKKIE